MNDKQDFNEAPPAYTDVVHSPTTTEGSAGTAGHYYDAAAHHETSAGPPSYESIQNLPAFTTASSPSYLLGHPTAPAAFFPEAPVPQYPARNAADYYYYLPLPLETTNVSESPPQQRQVLARNAGLPDVIHRQSVHSMYTRHVVFACIVTWLCNIVFGGIAFILAMMARKKASTNRKAAQKLGLASVGVAVLGIAVTAVLLAVVIPVGLRLAGRNSCLHQSPCSYRANGNCYQRVAYNSNYSECENAGCASYFDSYNHLCYYNVPPTTTMYSTTPHCDHHYVDGTCYRYRIYVSSSRACYRNHGNAAYYSSYYCYYNNNAASTSAANVPTTPVDSRRVLSTTDLSCRYYKAGRCYRYLSFVGSSTYCYVVYGTASYFTSHRCYYN